MKENEISTTKPLEIMCIDLCGPMRMKGMEADLYFILIINDHIRMPWVFFLNRKLKSFEFFRIFTEMVEKETYLRMKTLR